ncbi:MAG: hypothetical protein ACT4P1_02820 [Sporichthyaceae bacterium]
MRALTDGAAHLSVLDCDEAKGWYSVARGAKGHYSFTVDGPVRLEADDVPMEVTAAMLAASQLFHITVEGSSAADVPHAVRFARLLARKLNGAVVDLQTDQLWSKGVSRQLVEPTRNERVNMISFRWYCPFAALPTDWASTYLVLCRRLLPEALPRRFGEYEPFQHRLDEAGDHGFTTAWGQATSSLHFSASGPCLGGALWAGPNEQHPVPMWCQSADFHYGPLADDPRWRDAAQRWFLAIAAELGACYASAEVTRGHLWNGRSMGADGNSEWLISPARVQGWMGLPPYPTWWAWYGELYNPLVLGRLECGEVSERDGGLLAVITPQKEFEQPVALRAAVTVPAQLRTPPSI